jgi:hypothetical protein
MRTRRAFVLVALLATLAGAETASAVSWAQAEIRVAVESGLMGPSVAGFRPNWALTRRDLGQIVAGITQREQVVVDPERRVTVAELDRALVRALGLGPAAQKVRAELVASDLRPPSRAGTEILARLLATTIRRRTTTSSSCRATGSRGLRPPTRSPSSSASTTGSFSGPTIRRRRSICPLSRRGRLGSFAGRSGSSAIPISGAAHRSSPNRPSESMPGAGSTAPDSCGASTSSNGGPARRCSARRCSGARPMR